jgi:hypothetical protein
MPLTSRGLVRMFPRQWRRRYGDEFIAMLDPAPLDRRAVLDTLRCACDEWIFRTMTGRVVMGVMVATVANLAAWHLLSIVPLQADVQYLADGHKLVGPPWPTHLAASLWFVEASLFLRSVAGFFPSFRIGRGELVAWLILLCGHATIQQWSDVVCWLDTGIAAPSRWDVWADSAMRLTGGPLMLSYMTSMFFDPRFESRKSPYRANPNPLGLGRS